MANSRYTFDGRITASGAGSEARAYQSLLLNLCKSGCVLAKITIHSFGTVIDYTVEGNKQEIELFQKFVNRTV